MTVLRLTEFLERGERLPRPDRCPCEVSPPQMFPGPTLETQGEWPHSPISPTDLSPHEELLGDRGLLPAHLPESCAYPQDRTGEVPRPGAFSVQRVLTVKGMGAWKPCMDLSFLPWP